MGLKRCNLCGGTVVRLHPGVFGRRCWRCGSTHVHRAIGAVIDELPRSTSWRVYELSSRGALVRFLRRSFADLTLSEYFDGLPAGAWLRGVQCQDVERLTYEDARFDLVTSTEVFEHVADDRRGFAEVARVLAPGGLFVFTVPLSGSERSIERARRVEGGIEHLAPPEYHGDRLRGRGRVLAFRNYGLDILDRLSDAGFAAEIRTVDRPEWAISPPHPVIVARLGRQTRD